MKAGAHRAVVKRVGERDDRHALMVRHVGAHDGHRLALRETGRRVVERLIPAVSTTPARAGQTRKVSHRRVRRDHRGQRRGVRRDHGVVAEAALESQAGDAEGLILIRALQITSVVR